MVVVRENGGDDEETLLREAHIRRALRTAKHAHEKVVVVCGVYHVLVLTAKVEVIDDNALLKQLPKAKTQLTRAPRLHGRLTASSGYGVGVRSPDWYHHPSVAPDRPAEYWLTRVGAVLREYDLPTSSAHVIEGIRLAGILAVLYDCPMPEPSEV